VGAGYGQHAHGHPQTNHVPIENAHISTVILFVCGINRKGVFMSAENDISPIERLALMARQDDGEPEEIRLKMISFRVPVDLVASTDALAQLTGQSRNTTMIDLLRAGVYAVVNELDDPSTYHAICEHLLGE
jgi:hypothetical protein